MNFIFILILAAAAIFLQRRSAARGTDDIDYSFSAERNLVACGEEFSIYSTLTNRRKLPVLFLHLTEDFPEGMNITVNDTDAKIVEKEHFDVGLTRQVEQTFYIMPRQKLTRTLNASISARGCYRFRSATLKIGDLLGFEEFDSRISRNCEIVVYPDKADMPSFENAFGNWYGDISVRRYILPDPILTIGFHEYSGREPFKDISWPRTLQSGKMMVKEYDYTSEPAVTVMLNTYNAGREKAEACFKAMRTVCEKLETEGITYSVVSNTYTVGGISSFLKVNDGIGRQHLMNVLEGLGRASASSGTNFTQLLQSCRSRENVNRGYLLVSPALNLEDETALRRFEHQLGSQVLRVPVSGGDDE